MPESVNVFVDPHLITLPNPCQSVDDLERFITALLEWASAIEKDDINVLISQTALEALYNDGSYPYDYELRRLLQQFSAEEGFIADEDVCSLVTNLLQKTPYLEERINIDDILYEESNCRVEPDVFLTRLTAQAADALQTCLVMLGLWQQTATSAGTTSTGCIFATAQDSTVETCPELTVQASIDLVIPFSENHLWVYTFPTQVDESFHICLGHSDILQQAGCFKLWNAGKTEAGARDAIDLRIQELIQQGSANPKQIAVYSLGSKFLTSAQQWGFQRSDLAMILIDSCARILAGIPSKTVKPFRKSDNSPDQRQRTSDKALAWRNHLTKGGPGYRLMYWQKTTGEIEFANVGPKKELIIYE